MPPFKSGNTITALYVNEIHHSTTKETYTIHEINGEYQVEKQRSIFKSLEHISVLKEALIFLGDSIPYKTDSELNSFLSNWCINIVGDGHEPEKIKQWLREKNLNPHFTGWNSIRLCCTEAGEPFPVYKKLF